MNRLCRHRARPFDCIQNWEKNLEAFFQYLAASYKKYLDSILFTWWPESAFEPESALFQLIFYHVDREGAIKVIGLKFLYRKAVVPELKGVPFETPSVSANALGNIAVFTEIRIGKNKDFDQFRREPLLKSFIIDKQPANGVTKMAALEFARRLILVTSENTSRIENSTYHVSPTCDCMAIEPQRGLQWISVK